MPMVTVRSKIEYVIFDVDGLLIDSERVTIQAANDVLARYGKELTREMITSFRGYTGRVCAQKMLSAFPDLPLSVEGLLAQTDESQYRLFHLAKPLPGAVRLVKHLHAHGIPIAVATSSRRFYFLAKAQHSPGLFACFGNRTVCGDDHGIAKVKPAPDLFLAAAREKLGLDVGTPDGVCVSAQVAARSKGLIFEDAAVGIQAAKRAGMSAVWVVNEDLYRSADLNEQPDLVLNSLEEFVPEEWGLPPYSGAVKLEAYN